jgi:hypothetical protein
MISTRARAIASETSTGVTAAFAPNAAWHAAAATRPEVFVGHVHEQVAHVGARHPGFGQQRVDLADHVARLRLRVAAAVDHAGVGEQPGDERHVAGHDGRAQVRIRRPLALHDAAGAADATNVISTL